MSTLKVSTISPLGTDATKTITLGESAGTLAIASGAKTSGFGKIGQVISTTKTDYFDGASTSYVDITGMTATITPASTSSKVLVNIFLNLSHHSSGKFGFIKLQRNSTDICVGDAAGSRDQVTTGRYSAYGPNGFGMNICFLDSPSTTSACVYKLVGRASSGTFSVNRDGDDSDSSNRMRSASTFTLMEVLD